MRKNSNICKFVSSLNTEQITIKNFVYECNLEKIGKTLVKENNIMYLVASGNGTLRTGLFERKLSPGTLFFTFSGESFCIDNTDNLHLMYITFGGKRSDVLFEQFKISVANRIFEGYESLLSFWENCIGKANEKNLDLISESVLLYTFSQLYLVHDSEEQSLLGDILKNIEQNFTDSNFSLITLAEELNYNPKYLSRIFSKNIDITFSQYIKNLRINHAIFLIEQGITSIKNISFLSGYKDPLYFSNVFKKTVGLSPSDYIKQELNKKN